MQKVSWSFLVCAGLAAGSATAASPVMLACIKAVEYACLGILLAQLSGKPQARAKAHALTGLCVGAVFGGFIVWMITRAASNAGHPLAAPAVVSTAINEILFPVGCSLVIHSAHYLGRRVAAQVK